MNRLINTFVLAMCGAFLVGCNDYDQESWNQKVIVEVETPEGPVTGSTVQRVQFSKAKFSVPQGPSHSFKTTGEAVVVDLGSAGTLFVLLRGDIKHDAAALFAPIAFARGVRGATETVKVVKSQPIGARAELPEVAYPMMVTFTDIDDPRTVRTVDPSNLAAVFGPSIKLKGIVVEITNESAIRDRIDTVLNWWSNKAFLEQIWPELSSQERSILSSVNWRKG